MLMIYSFIIRRFRLTITIFFQVTQEITRVLLSVFSSCSWYRRLVKPWLGSQHYQYNTNLPIQYSHYETTNTVQIYQYNTTTKLPIQCLYKTINAIQNYQYNAKLLIQYKTTNTIQNYQYNTTSSKLSIQYNTASSKLPIQ